MACASIDGTNIFSLGHDAGDIVDGTSGEVAGNGTCSVGSYNPTATAYRCEVDQTQVLIHNSTYHPPYLWESCASGSTISKAGQWPCYWGINDMELSSDSTYRHVVTACDSSSF